MVLMVGMASGLERLIFISQLAPHMLQPKQPGVTELGGKTETWQSTELLG